MIVVTYNQRDSISRTLDHILSQRVDFPFEIVVGDDASADGTRACVRSMRAVIRRWCG